MQRHRNQASQPEILTPRICATADPWPREPSVPRPSNANSDGLPPRMAAAILVEQVVASRVACCAVGGTALPEPVLIAAQSPSAHTCPSYPSSSSPLFTSRLPFSFAHSN